MSAARVARRLSVKGASFIGRFEGYRGAPYNDPVGHATIGFGHLIHRGNVTAADRRKWGTLTRAQALALLRKDAATFESCVAKAVKVPINQAQFDALVSFAFNVGCGAFAASTLVRELNAEHRTKAANELLRWDKADGKKLAGLTRRRQEERRLFLTGYYEAPPAKRKPLPTDAPRPYAQGPSKSFTWLEVHKGRAGMTPAVRQRAITHARKLERLKVELNKLRVVHKLKPTGINVLSWFRPRWYNEQIHGASDSRHIYGDGTDISLQEIDRLCPWASGRKDFDRVADKLFATGGFGQYPAGSRHVDSRGHKARWTTF